MKLLCFADTHIGVKAHGKLDPTTGFNTREIQSLNTLEEVCDYAINNNIEVVIFAGDMYKNSMPSPSLQDEVNKRIKKVADAGINFLILDGNHDVSKMENFVSPLKGFKTFSIKNVYHTRFHNEIIIDGYRFVFLPTYHTKEEIEKIVEQTNYDLPVIFIGHMSIKDALLNDWTVADKEVYIDLEIFNKSNVAAVVLGHLHKYQILNSNPLVFYTGSTQRIDFNEERQPKGFVVLDVNGTNVTNEYIEVESQKFHTSKHKFDNEALATSLIVDDLKKDAKKIKDAIVRVQVEMDELTKINDKDIYEAAYALGAANVLNIQKIVNSDKAVRNAELTEHVSIEKGLELYYKDKPRGEQRIKLGKEIMKKVEELYG